MAYSDKIRIPLCYCRNMLWCWTLCSSIGV